MRVYFFENSVILIIDASETFTLPKQYNTVSPHYCVSDVLCCPFGTTPLCELSRRCLISCPTQYRYATSHLCRRASYRRSRIESSLTGKNWTRAASEPFFTLSVLALPQAVTSVFSLYRILFIRKCYSRWYQISRCGRKWSSVWCTQLCWSKGYMAAHARYCSTVWSPCR